MNKVNVVDRIVDQARNQAGLNVIKGKLSCRTADKKNGQSKGSRENENLRGGFKRGKTGALIVDLENSSNRVCWWSRLAGTGSIETDGDINERGWKAERERASDENSSSAVV